MRCFIFIFFFLFSSPNKGELIDRIVAVFNDQVITLSEIQQIQFNLKARSHIAQDLYEKRKYSIKELVDKEINTRVIRAHLNNVGYLVDDNRVEATINRIQKKYGITREQITEEINRKNISFVEYFELMRASREYNLMLDIVIMPLVTIKEQQIKNRFFSKNIKNSAFSINYSLNSYEIPKHSLKKKDKKKFFKALPQYKSHGIIPKKFSSISKIKIGNIKEDDLMPKIKKLLKQTNEGAFSEPILIGESYISYYIDKKDLVESSFYQKQRDEIYQSLFKEETKKILSIWLAREREKHYIKVF